MRSHRTSSDQLALPAYSTNWSGHVPDPALRAMFMFALARNPFQLTIEHFPTRRTRDESQSRSTDRIVHPGAERLYDGRERRDRRHQQQWWRADRQLRRASAPPPHLATGNARRRAGSHRGRPDGRPLKPISNFEKGQKYATTHQSVCQIFINLFTEHSPI